MPQDKDATRGSDSEAADEAERLVRVARADQAADFYVRLVERGVYQDHARDITVTYLEHELSKEDESSE
jgi:hypothetical protein